MTGPLLHGRQTCSLIPVGVELDLTASTPRHRARRAENPPRMWTPFGGRHRADVWPGGCRCTIVSTWGGHSVRQLNGCPTCTPTPPPRSECPCPCHVSPGVSHIAPCCYPVEA